MEPNFALQKQTFDKLISTQKGNWKCPGRDRVHLFFVKKVTALHYATYVGAKKALEEGEGLPNFLSYGETLLIPKKDKKKKRQPSL